MLKQRFNPMMSYRVGIYARVSSDNQNKDSPEQQIETIEKLIHSMGLPWVVVKVYIDRGISGQTISKRPQLLEMLRDIRTKMVTCDLLLVDTYERFGRTDEMAGIRRELATTHGVLLLTADSHFSDPESASGRALAAVDQMRSTEENRIKAHQVLRGKRDALSRKHWPGGPPPCGYTTKLVLTTKNGHEEVDYSILVKDPKTNWIVELIFKTADEKGWGTTRLSKFLNSHPDIPESEKPFCPDTVGYILDNPIYYGEMLWEENSTGYVNDRRVIERNLDSEMVRIPDYCEPTVSREKWDKVQEVRQLRSHRLKEQRARRKDDDGKHIRRRGAGITLKYPLSGLLRCGECGRSMQPMSSGGRLYAYYHCPGHAPGLCKNGCYVREGWLRQCVIGKIRERLLPPPSDGTQVPEWFPELLEMLKAELTLISAAEVDRRPAKEVEIAELTGKLTGWAMSLGDPTLPVQLREDVKKLYSEAQQRILQLQAEVDTQDALNTQMAQLADTDAVLKRLHSLADVLSKNNPTRTNLELAKHIEAIECFASGKVDMYTSRLGILEGANLLLRRGENEDSACNSPIQKKPAIARLRPRLNVDEANGGCSGEPGAAASELRSAQGVDRKWCWKDTFDVPGRTCWAAEHAQEVLALRCSNWTLARIAKHMEVSIPTIRHALRLAEELKRKSS